MAKSKLSIEEQLITAGELVVRSRIFFDIWFLYASRETRPKLLPSMNEYSEFFRYDEHAHFVAFVVHIAALYEKRNDTINLKQLISKSRDLEKIDDKAKEALNTHFDSVGEVVKKIAILRHNLFAHRSHSIEYEEAFSLAKVTPNEMRKLSDTAFKIVNTLLAAAELPDHSINPMPTEDAKALILKRPAI